MTNIINMRFGGAAELRMIFGINKQGAVVAPCEDYFFGTYCGINYRP